VLLKQQIRQHWDEGDHRFTAPEIGEDEKTAVREILLRLLFKVPASVCTPLGVSIAVIANWDFPEVWPEVLPTLLKAVSTDSASDEVCKCRTPNSLDMIGCRVPSSL
jgi:importin-9